MSQYWLFAAAPNLPQAGRISLFSEQNQAELGCSPVCIKKEVSQNCSRRGHLELRRWPQRSGKSSVLGTFRDLFGHLRCRSSSSTARHDICLKQSVCCQWREAHRTFERWNLFPRLEEAVGSKDLVKLREILPKALDTLDTSDMSDMSDKSWPFGLFWAPPCTWPSDFLCTFYNFEPYSIKQSNIKTFVYTVSVV